MLDASPLRDAEAILASLRSRPLQALGEDELERFASAALTTAGSVNDYKHFLPRILYFAAMDVSFSGFEPHTVFSKLQRGRWDTWPVAERTAVSNLFYSAWAYERLQNTDVSNRSWEWIAAMAALGLQFEACLSLWIRRTTANAMLQLAEGGREIKGLQRGGGLWHDVSSDQRNHILEWLTSDGIERALVETIDKVAAPQRWQIERMLGDIDELRRSRQEMERIAPPPG